MVIKIVLLSLVRFFKFLPLLIVAVIAGRVVSTFMSTEKSKKILDKKKKNITRAAGIGLISPGPLSGYLPLLKILNEKGFPLSEVVAFITSQTLIGPMRLFLEVDYFGIAFFIYRVVASFFMAVFVGTYYRLLEDKGEF